jgi:hypothetical protein
VHDGQFCATAADLWSRTFKPALDVVLATARMSENMGWKGLAVLYTYFAFGGTVVRWLSRPFLRRAGRRDGARVPVGYEAKRCRSANARDEQTQHQERRVTAQPPGTTSLQRERRVSG